MDSDSEIQILSEITDDEQNNGITFNRATSLTDKITVIGVLLILSFIPFVIDWDEFLLSVTDFGKIIIIFEIILVIITTILLIGKAIISNVEIHKRDRNIGPSFDNNYYRNLLVENSTGILSFIYDKKVNYVDVIISTILKLEKEKYIFIDFTNKNIQLLSNDYSNLSFYEQYLIIIFNKKSNNNLISFSDIKTILLNNNFKINILYSIKKSALDSGYFTTKSYNFKFYMYIFLFNMAMTTILAICYGGFTVAVCFATSIYILIASFYLKKKFYLKTTAGKLLYNKLCGLKLFLKDEKFAKDKGVDDIKLWDYYIIYAIIFNIKGDLNNNVNELYDLLTD
jgi:hypothetical protein